MDDPIAAVARPPTECQVGRMEAGRRGRPRSEGQRLLWRSKDSDDLSSNVDKNIEKLQKDIGKMFHNFPPK